MKKNNTKMYLNWLIKRIALIAYDIVAINLSYYVALLVRFFVGDQFLEESPQFFAAFERFAPWYTLLCLVVFFLFRFYDSHWRYAGISDLNRLFIANLLTFVIQLAGTMLFVRRMPIKYYLIGGTLQFFAVSAIRFSYRLLHMELSRIRNIKHASLNVMIVGVGETGRIVRTQLENDKDNMAHPVCILNYNAHNVAGNLDGIPVVTDVDQLQAYIKKFNVQCVILADSLMPIEIRRKIRNTCSELKIEVQDFSSFNQTDGAGISLKHLMEYTSGPVDVIAEGKKQSFSSGEAAVMNLPGKYVITALYAENGHLIVETTDHQVILNDTNAAWVQEHEERTGKEISFF